MADTVLETINTGLSPTYFAYNPANKYIFVANGKSGTIPVISPLVTISKPDIDDTLKPTFKKNLQ